MKFPSVYCSNLSVCPLIRDRTRYVCRLLTRFRAVATPPGNAKRKPLSGSQRFRGLVLLVKKWDPRRRSGQQSVLVRQLPNRTFSTERLVPTECSSKLRRNRSDWKRQNVEVRTNDSRIRDVSPVSSRGSKPIHGQASDASHSFLRHDLGIEGEA